MPAGNRSITPAYKGPRRFAFRIRRRGFTFEGTPSILISNSNGVWSVTHRRYIRKTRDHRFHDLKKELDPIRKAFRDLAHRFKVDLWPQYTQDEELRSLRRKLADLYWALMPEEGKTRVVLFYRRQRRRRLVLYTGAVVVLALEGFVMMCQALAGFYSLRVSLFLGLCFLGAVYVVDRADVEWGLS